VKDIVETIYTPLHKLACLADPTSSDYSTQENQLTLGRQLIEHGGYANAPIYPESDTPLHSVCYSSNTTNLDFIDLNAEDHLGQPSLLYITKYAHGAAKCLLKSGQPQTPISPLHRECPSCPRFG
jgi:hypothetical protein